MPIEFSCPCGRAFAVNDEFAGKKTRCPACKAALVVPQPAADEDAAFEMLAADGDAIPETPAPPRRDPMPESLRPPDRPAPPPPKPPRPIPRSRDEDYQAPRGISLSPAVAGGLASMAIAAVWFFVALSANRIAIFAPVVFVLGLISVIKGLLGHPEE
jgi:hypothetical protein